MLRALCRGVIFSSKRALLLPASMPLCLHSSTPPCLSLQLVFEYFTERTPRSYIDPRETSLVWNYKYSGDARCTGTQVMQQAVNGMHKYSSDGPCSGTQVIAGGS